MKKRKSFWLCFLLTAILVLSGCQTSSLKEEQTSGESQEEADRSLEEDSREEDTRSSQEQNEKKPEYIDEAYVDAQYEDEEEDFSKYNSKQVLPLRKQRLPQNPPGSLPGQNKGAEIRIMDLAKARPVRIIIIRIRCRKGCPSLWNHRMRRLIPIPA